MSFEHRCERWDADYGIPRRANEDYLPPLQAFYRWLGDVTQSIIALLAAVIAALLFIFSGVVLGLGIYGLPVIGFAIVVAFILALATVWNLCDPYFEWHRMTTHGSARWASPEYLEGHNFARAADDLPQRGEIQLGLLPRGFFRRAHRFIIPALSVLGSFIFFGSPGMGKSVLLMSYLRLWGWFGNSCIVIDPKGELYKYAARFFRKVYRIDFINPRNSDRWNFMPRCKDNREYASMIASVIMACAVKKNSNADQYWENAERSLLTALLLYIPHKVDRPAPAMLAQFIQGRSLEQIGEELSKCELDAVRAEWGNFNKAPDNTRGSIFSGLATVLQPFTIDAAQAITAALTEEDTKSGVGEIDFTRLREPGTAVFLVIPEGMAKRYKVPLSTFFSEAVEALRQGEVKDDATPVLLVVDEAAHVNFTELNEVAGVGRGRRFALMLFYQNLSQGYEQYGHDGFHAIIGSINTKTVLPGCDLPTTEMFSKLVADMTIDAHIFDDAPGTDDDKTRHSPQARALISPNELRQMLKFRQAVTITETMPPVKWRMPDSVKDHIQLVPREYAPPKLLNFEQALAETAHCRKLEQVEHKAQKRGIDNAGEQPDEPTAEKRDAAQRRLPKPKSAQVTGDTSGSATNVSTLHPVKTASHDAVITSQTGVYSDDAPTTISGDSPPLQFEEEQTTYSHVFSVQEEALVAHVNRELANAFELTDRSITA